MSALTKRMSTLLSKNKPPKDLATSLEKKESPETRAPRLIKEFCNASSENSSAADEVIYLPYIREAVEASPAAAKAALKAIHKYVSNSTTTKAGALYNSVMLIRILSDSPGPAFTQHFDERFVGTLQLMLKYCDKQEPQLILQQTLEYFEREKSADDNLGPVIAMWKTQKASWSNASMQRRGWASPPPGQQPRQQRINSLPPPQELAERISEADTSVQLLTQFLQTTPQAELPTNELIREFTNRCKSARESMQAYIDCQNPEPDGETLMTLVQTQQRISAVLNKRNVAVSQARAATGSSPSPNPSRSTSNQAIPTTNGSEGPLSPLSLSNNSTARAMSPTSPSSHIAGPGTLSSPPVLPHPEAVTDPAARLDDPFDDSNQIAQNGANGQTAGTGALGDSRQRPALSVNTSYTRRQGSSNTNPGTTALADGAAKPNVPTSRFRIV